MANLDSPENALEMDPKYRTKSIFRDLATTASQIKEHPEVVDGLAKLAMEKGKAGDIQSVIDALTQALSREGYVRQEIVK